MSQNLYKVKHWELINGDYMEAPDIKATWFIDPPYKGEAGLGYRFGSNTLDYRILAEWALKRKGELIFCEGKDGDYLPFKPQGSCRKSKQRSCFLQKRFYRRR